MPSRKAQAMSKMLKRRISAEIENGSSIRDRDAVPPGPSSAFSPHFSQWPRYMQETLVQRLAPVYRKPRQDLSGFSIDTSERIVFSHSTSPTAIYYTLSLFAATRKSGQNVQKCELTTDWPVWRHHLCPVHADGRITWRELTKSRQNPHDC
jgi:hypothetical protein